MIQIHWILRQMPKKDLGSVKIPDPGSSRSWIPDLPWFLAHVRFILVSHTAICLLICVQKFQVDILTLARTGGGWCNPPWGFSRIAKKRRRVAPPGFGLPYGANLAQFLAKKIWPGQVRSRSYDVIRGTTSGNFSNKVVFSRNLTWRHWCKW